LENTPFSPNTRCSVKALASALPPSVLL